MKSRTDNKADIRLKWFGPKTGQQIVIFVHGFAVRSDSKGLFTDLAGHFEDAGITSVLFYLSDYDQQGNSTFLSLPEQQQRLRQVYKQVRELNPEAEISFIAHSMGTGVLSTVLPDFEFRHAIMLAPATDSPGPKIKDSMIKHLGAKVAGDSISFKRRNGSISTFSEDYIRSFDVKFSEIYKRTWPGIPNLKIFIAEEDCKRYDDAIMEFYGSLGATTFEDCDHNFSNVHRTKLSQALIKHLS